jgi:hypothetical protein
MLMIQTLHQIATQSHIMGFRGCPTSTGISLAHVENRSKRLKGLLLLNRKIHREWLNAAWKRHALENGRKR